MENAAILAERSQRMAEEQHSPGRWLDGHVAGHGAWVVYDLYWDPVSSHATQAEADAVAGASGCHVIFDPQGRPGQLRDDNFGHWDDFLRQMEDPDDE